MFAQGRVDARQVAFQAGRRQHRQRLVAEAEHGEDYADWDEPVGDTVFIVPELLLAPDRSEVDESRGAEFEEDALEDATALFVQALEEQQAEGAEALEEEQQRSAAAGAEEEPTPEPADGAPSDEPDPVALALAAGAEAEAAAAAGVAVVEWEAVMQQAPKTRAEATYRPPSLKTLKLLRWMKRRFERWQEEKKVVVDAEKGPSWIQVHEYLQYASGSRLKRCLADPSRMGMGKRTLVNMAFYMGKYVLPTCYPTMFRQSADVEGGIGKGELRAWVNDWKRAVISMFVQGNQLALGHEVEAHVSAECTAAATSGEAQVSASGTEGAPACPMHSEHAED